MPVPRFALCASTTLIASTLVAAIVISAPSDARAGFTVTFQQVGSDVVATGSGSLNLTALNYSGQSFNVTPRVISATGGTSGTAILGAAANIDRLISVAGPVVFGTGGNIAATSGIGESFVASTVFPPAKS